MAENFLNKFKSGLMKMKKFNYSDMNEYWTSNSGNTSDESYSLKTKVNRFDVEDFNDSDDDEDESEIEDHSRADVEVIKFDCNNLEDTIKYRAEGNANIVLALLESGQVIRFRKKHFSELENEIISGKQSINGECDDIKELKNFITYVKILKSYFSSYFIQIPKIVYLDVDNLHLLNEFLLQYRPVDRINKVIGTKYGLLYPDVTFLPKRLDLQRRIQNYQEVAELTYCVEIKPKQGWMFDDDADEDFLLDGDNQLENLLNVQKCRYCLMQYYKLQNSQIENVSSYCPIDLFSGVPHRMKNAIRGLIKNPQNNFRIFKDGEIVYGENSHKYEFHNVLSGIFKDVCTEKKRKHWFINLLEKTLTKDYSMSCDNNVDVCSNYKDRTLIHFRSCKFNENAIQLPRNSVLKKIFDAQLLVKNNFEQMKIYNLHENSDSHQYFYKLFQTNTSSKMEKSLKEYMIGATALDCQVMITFQKIPDMVLGSYSFDQTFKNHLVTLNGTTFVTNVIVMDLDPKSFKHFEKYRTQYRETKLAFNEYLRREIK